MRLFGRKREDEDGLELPSDDDTGLSGPLGSATVTVTPTATVAPPLPASTPLMAAGSIAVMSQLLSGHGPVGELVKQIRSDPQAFRERMLAQAKAAGGSAFVLTPQGLAPIGHPAGAPVPEHVDVIDELTKVADLHDKGALSDAEFQQLKDKLLAH
jgi:hypothetical protein